MAKPTDPDNEGTLYRFFNRRGELLYVGISMSSLASRLRKHSRESNWFNQAEMIFLERVPKANLRLMERIAIESEQPRFNKQYSAPGRRPPTATARELRNAPALVPFTTACEWLGDPSGESLWILIGIDAVRVSTFRRQQFVNRTDLIAAIERQSIDVD